MQHGLVDAVLLARIEQLKQVMFVIKWVLSQALAAHDNRFPFMLLCLHRLLIGLLKTV